MGIRIREDRRSGRRTGGAEGVTEERVYTVWKVGGDSLRSDQAEVALFNSDACPYAIGPIEVDAPIVRTEYTTEPISERMYRITVGYRPQNPADPPGPGDSGQTTFSVSAETQHIQVSYQTTDKKFSALMPGSVDNGGLIGVDSMGDVKGVDIVVPRLRFAKTKYYAPQVITSEFVRSVSNLVGTVSSEPFMGFAVGEIMLYGVDGQINFQKNRAEIQFTFDTSPNQTDIQIGDLTYSDTGGSKTNTGTGVNKRGFDYLWVGYEKVDQNTPKKTSPKPVQVNVERVYRYTNWSYLGSF